MLELRLGLGRRLPSGFQLSAGLVGHLLFSLQIGKGINSFKKGLAEKDDPKVINAEDTNKDKTTV